MNRRRSQKNSPTRGGGKRAWGLSVTRGALYLALGVLAASALQYLLFPEIVLKVDKHTWTNLTLWSLVTNSLVCSPTSFLSLAIFIAIAGFLFWDRLRMAWYTNRIRLVVTLAIPFGVLFLLDHLAPRGVVWGMASAMVMVLWFATSVEYRWGTQRLLFFALWIALVTNLFASALLVVWPESVFAATNSSYGPTHGVQPLTYALLTVWCLMNSQQYFPLLRIQVKKLIWVLVALSTIDFLFVGRLGALMELLAIGTTYLLVYGLWRPQALFDRIRLWWIERRVAKRRSRMRGIDGGRSH